MLLLLDCCYCCCCRLLLLLLLLWFVVAVDFNCCRRSIAQILIGFVGGFLAKDADAVCHIRSRCWRQRRRQRRRRCRDADANADANAAVSLCVAAAKINYDIMIYKINRKWCGLFSCYSLPPPLCLCLSCCGQLEEGAWNSGHGFSYLFSTL